MNITLERDQILYLPTDEQSIDVRVSSAGVWMIVNHPQRWRRYALLVQQQDQPLKEFTSKEDHYPWGITAGRVNHLLDQTPAHIAVREAEEETGIKLDPNALTLLTVFRRRTESRRRCRHKAGIIFVTELNINDLSLQNAKETREGVIRFDPPPTVDRSEVRQLALRPLETILSNNTGIQPNYQWRPHYLGVTALYHAGYLGGYQPRLPNL